MRVSLGRRQFLAKAVLGGICSAAGCGTMLYPERRGQPAGQLDWGIVLLDGIGLLLFFIPGVIAFAVDFATGTIYLPPDDDLRLSAGEHPRAFKSIKLAANRLTPSEIASAVTAETGRMVGLREGHYYTAELHDLESFWPARDHLAATYETKPTTELPQAPSS